MIKPSSLLASCIVGIRAMVVEVGVVALLFSGCAATLPVVSLHHPERRGVPAREQLFLWACKSSRAQAAYYQLSG